MDEGFDLGRVIGDGELDRGAALVVAPLQDQTDALLQLRRIHGIVEVQRHGGLLGRRIGGVLVELSAARRHGEGRHVEGEMIVRHQHMRGEGAGHVEGNFDMGADRPILGRDKMQGAVVGPAPHALERRRHADALGDGLADQLDGRRGSGELHVQRMDDDLVNAVGGGIVGDRGRRSLEGDPLRLGRMGKMPVPVPAAPRGGDKGGRAQRAAGIGARVFADMGGKPRHPVRA